MNARVIAVFASAIVVVVLGFTAWPQSDESKASDVVKAWLDDLRKGNDTSPHWKESSPWPAPVFWSVASYEIVDVPYPGRYLVRIHSSTREGMPRVRLYEVMCDGMKVYRVTAQGEDPNADILSRAFQERHLAQP